MKRLNGSRCQSYLLIAHIIVRQRLTLAIRPDEAAFFMAFRLNNNGHLVRLIKKVILDKAIHLREEHTEAGMGVIPADDLLVFVLSVHDVVDMVPGLMGKGHLGPVVLGMFARHPYFLFIEKYIAYLQKT